MASDGVARLDARQPLDHQAVNDQMPASRGRTVAGTVIAVLLVLYTLAAAASLLVPIAAAVLLSMLLAPAVQLLERLHIPRLIASAIVVFSILGLLGVGMVALAGPAKTWIEQTTQNLQKLQQRLPATAKPLEDIKKATGQLQQTTSVVNSPAMQEIRVAEPSLGDLLLSGIPHVIASILSTTILVYFLLVAGDVFLRKLVLVIPTFRDKKRAVDITRQIETDISFYLLNFTLVNIGLGTAMTIVTALLGFPNPLLWGVLVAVLNFVPYVGAITSLRWSVSKPLTACRTRWPRRQS
jgi:predicted PurR-regulated permease PerM